MKTPRNILKFTTAVMFALLCGSCHARRPIEHYSVLVELSPNGVQRVPDSNLDVVLIRSDLDQKKCLFEVTHAGLGETTEEWVMLGEYFESKPWLGIRRLKLVEISEGKVVLQRFGTR